MRTERGFTIFELLLTLTVIAIIAGIAVPLIAAYRQRTYDGLALRTLRDALVAQEAYYTKEESYLSCVGPACAVNLPSFRIANTVHLGFRVDDPSESDSITGVSCSTKGTGSGRAYFRVVRIAGADQFSNVIAEDTCSDDAVTAFLDRPEPR